MISIDTNVLLRRLLQDDEEQSLRANRIFESHRNILITDIVLAETVWTLKGKRYGVDRHGIAAAITSLLQEPGIVFESADAVWAALNEYLAAPPVPTPNGAKLADFPDALIVNKSKRVATQAGATLDGVYTFDQAALALSGTKKP